MGAPELVSIFTALAPTPVLQWVFGGVVIAICIFTFSRQKPAQAAAVPAPTALPNLGDPQMYFQGPVALMKLHEQMRDMLVILVEEARKQTAILHEIEQRQETMRVEAREDARAPARR